MTIKSLPAAALKIFIPLILFAASLNAQVVYTPVNDPVYDYLDRMASKQLIDIPDEVKPYARNLIAGLLEELNNKRSGLNSVEKEELDWLMREYTYELGDTSVTPRYRLYSYTDSLFQFQLSPSAAFAVRNQWGEQSTQRWIGAHVFGSYGSNFGFDINMRDTGEFGDNIDSAKTFTPVTAYDYILADDGIEYSDVRATVTLSWDWGAISLAKDYMKWGHGKFGNLILSDKAASFPFIRLELQPVEWMRFNYTHAWLNSLVIDSTKTRLSTPNSLLVREEEEFVPKYYVANLITIIPTDWLDVSFGNSFVYSGDLRPEMFIPFMFFKYLDRDTGRGIVNDGNGQLFLDVSARYFKNIQLYSTVFLEVAEISKILEGEQNNTWYGFTVGGKGVNTLIDNLDLTLEYTRLNPWIYEHKNLTTTYKHLDYPLGHWIGQNADQFRVQFDYQFMRGLKFKLYYEKLNKGGLTDIYYAYKEHEDEEFLYGNNRSDTNIGFEASYEPIHELFITAKFKYSDISDEEPGRTHEFMLGTNQSFSLALHYGLFR